MNQPDARTELFRSSWSVYDLIVERNYMSHREIHSVVRSVLRARHRLGEYSLLDLGCGNARALADCLREFPPVRYEGVDLSRVALAEAAERLRFLPSVELREQDLLAAAEGVAPGSFDVVYSGFAMHHLSGADKRRLFQACATSLAPSGEFLLVDVVRESRQSREQCLEDYLRMMRTDWSALDPDQLEEACRHVSQHDFPETFASLAEMARSAGLGRSRLLERFRQHHVLDFSR